MKMSPDAALKTIIACSSAIMLLIVIMLITLLVSCCTLSFSNVMTSGVASDVVDDTESIKSDPNLTIPVKL
jgi:hypothetical protein